MTAVVDAAPDQRRSLARRHRLLLLLAFNSGAIDAVGLVALGGVFTSVMTGNMIFLGSSAASGDGATALRAALAIVLFMTGAYAGGRLAGRPQPGDRPWPPHVTRCLLVELAALLAFGVLWWAAGDAPGHHLQLALLGLDSVALGLQSSAIVRFGVSGLSTTYMTGTLTTLVVSLAHRQSPRGVLPSLRLLVALVAGAAAAVVLHAHLPVVVPLLQLVTVGLVVALAGRS